MTFLSFFASQVLSFSTSLAVKFVERFGIEGCICAQDDIFCYFTGLSVPGTGRMSIYASNCKTTAFGPDERLRMEKEIKKLKVLIRT